MQKRALKFVFRNLGLRLECKKPGQEYVQIRRVRAQREKAAAGSKVSRTFRQRGCKKIASPLSATREKQMP